MILGIIAFVLILGLIVLVHEGGHFLFAKKAGILCYEFSIGMGPVIYQKRRGETVYSIRGIPMGGFVSMAGEEVEAEPLRGVKSVKLEFDENQSVKKIILNLDNPKYKDLPVYSLLSYDILGTMDQKDGELFIKVVKERETEQDENVIVTYNVLRNSILSNHDKTEMQIAPIERNFNSKSAGKRFITVFGGPLMNFILALLIYLILGVMQGYPTYDSAKINEVVSGSPVFEILEEGDTLISINGQKEFTNWEDLSNRLQEISAGDFTGQLEVLYLDSSDNNTKKKALITPLVTVISIEMMFDNDAVKDNKPVIGLFGDENTMKKTKTYKAGFREGDLITKIKIDNEITEIKTIDQVLKIFSSEKLENPQNVEITVMREEKEVTNSIEIYSKKMLDTQGVTACKVQLGVSPEYKVTFLKLLYMPFVDTWNTLSQTAETLGLLFTKSGIGLKDFSGPVGIFNLISSSAKQGVRSILSLTALLSVNIGFVNLLPLPALDGSRLVFIAYEGITKRKVNKKVENIVHSVGFILLMGLLIYITMFDIARCFG